MTTGAQYHEVNGQLQQVGLDPQSGVKPRAGTCINCGEPLDDLSKHYQFLLGGYICQPPWGVNNADPRPILTPNPRA